MVTRACRRCASCTTADSSSGAISCVSPQVLSASLIKSTPCLHWRRTSVIISDTSLASMPMACSGVPTHDGSLSVMPPYVTMKRPAQAMRGPSIKPISMASRIATSLNQVPPGTAMLVTPVRKTCWALRAARRALNPGLVVPRAAPDVLWKRANALNAVALDDDGLIGGGRIPGAVDQGAVLNDDGVAP